MDQKSNIPIHGSLKSYTLGFIGSIILTIIPFVMVTNPVFTQGWLLIAIFAFAIAQMFIQLYCFMHVGDEAKPRWINMSIWFVIFNLTIIVSGSLWIMYHLSHNMGH